MKQLLTYCALLLCGFGLLSSCSGGNSDSDNSTTNDYIRIDNNVNSISLSAGEKQKKISVYSNCSWQITLENSNWTTLSVDRTEGSNNVDIWLSTDENTTTSTRYATLTFKSPGITKTLTVTQASGELSLTVSPSAYEFAADGGEYNFTVEGNSDWKVSSKPDWCEIVGSAEGKSGRSLLAVKVGENPSTTARNGQIIIAGEKTATLEVSQQGKAYSLTVSTNAFNIPAIGGQQSIIITTNGSWRINIDNSAWCKVDKQSGVKNTVGEEVVITCDPNPTTEERYANVTVVAGNDAKIETIRVTQLNGTLPVVTAPQYEVKNNVEVTLTAGYESMFDVTEYGFCYGTAEKPTQKHQVGTNGGKNGSIQATLTLEEGKTYYVRTYAVSAVGATYSDDVKIEMKGRQPAGDDNTSPIL